MRAAARPPAETSSLDINKRRGLTGDRSAYDDYSRETPRPTSLNCFERAPTRRGKAAAAATATTTPSNSVKHALSKTSHSHRGSCWAVNRRSTMKPAPITTARQSPPSKSASFQPTAR